VSNAQGALTEALRHHQSGQLAEAEQLYRRILASEPAHTDALHLLGVLLQQANHPAAAVRYLERAVELAASISVYHYSLGDTYRMVGRVEDAIAAYRRSLALDPRTPEVYDHLGATLTQAERFDDAVEAFRKALHLRPGFPEAHNNLGFTYLRKREPENAESCLRSAIEGRRDFAEAHNNLGVSLLKQQRREEAAAAFTEAVRWKPGYAEAHRNLGRTLLDLDRAKEAIPHLQTAVRLGPSQGLSYAGLGDALQSMGRTEEAALCCQTGVERDPDCAETHFVHSQIALLRGDFERGWEEYEWRLKMWKPTPRLRRDGSQIAAWDGSPLNGRRILLYCEQGLGDNIQFVRYRRLVAEAGGEVVLECSPRLAPLFKAAFACEVFSEGSELPDCDLAVALPSLPRMFRTTRQTIPAHIPYLQADPRLVEAWNERMPCTGKIRVGLVWGGNPKFGADRRRSLRLEQFAPLAEIPGLALFSLQRGVHAEQLETAPFPIQALEEESHQITDTAAIIRNLDLLISADTMPAHLAGALGAPVWTVLHFSPDWRWMQGSEQSPWYPSMRLFRQAQPGDWESVIRNLTENLRNVYHL
jgi:tetratricopeptide (TPR) repeat protein